jgi:hypothetical protein
MNEPPAADETKGETQENGVPVVIAESADSNGSNSTPPWKAIVERATTARRQLREGGTSRQTAPMSASMRAPSGAELITAMAGRHEELIGVLQEMNSRTVSDFAAKLQTLIEALEASTSVMKERLQPSIGHLESINRELRIDVERAHKLIEEAPKALRESERRLNETLDLLHSMMRSAILVLLSGVATLVGVGIYNEWRQERLLRAILVSPPAATSPQRPPEAPATRGKHPPGR